MATLAISTHDRNGTNNHALIEAADDSTSPVRGHVRLVDTADRANWAEFAIIGEAETEAGWYALPVLHVGSAGAFAADAILAVGFARTGDAGAVAGPGQATVGQPVVFASSDGNTITGGETLTPGQIDADQDDYAPPGMAGAVRLRLSADAPRALTGLAGGADGRAMALFNAGAHPLTLADGAGASAAANRFDLGGTDLTLGPGQAVALVYDGPSARWVGRPPGPDAADVRLAPPVAGAQDVQAALQALAAGGSGGPDAYFEVDGNGSNQALTNRTAVGMDWTREVADEGGHFDLAGNKWTPPAGLVMLQASLQTTTANIVGGQTDLFLRLEKNGSPYQLFNRVQAALDGSALFCIGTLVEFANGTDEYRLLAQINNADGDGDANGSANVTFWKGMRLRAE